MVGENALHRAVQVFIPRMEGIAVRGGGRQQADFREMAPQDREVALLELDFPSRLHPFPGFVGIAVPYLHFIHGHVAEVVHDAVAQPVPGRQQHDEHEDAPGDGEAREERPQLVVLGGARYLPQVVPVKHGRSLSLSCRSVRLSGG